MYKLIKYELKKQWFSKIVILFTTILLQSYFLLSIFLEKDNHIATASAMLFFLVLIVFTYIAFEVVGTYAKDLNEKCSYMLFLTPNNSYKILGSKIITTVLQIMLFSIIYFILFIIDIRMVVVYFDYLDGIKEVITLALDTFFIGSILRNYDFYTIVIQLIKVILDWIIFVVTALFAITLSNTLLYNKKFKNIISFIFFILVSTFINYFNDFLRNSLDIYIIKEKLIFDCIFIIVCTVVIYVITAYMVEKKLSV